VRSFPLVEQDDLLWIWMSDPVKADPATIVSYPWHNDTPHWPHSANDGSNGSEKIGTPV
jgi:hypothetical protein